MLDSKVGGLSANNRFVDDDHRSLARIAARLLYAKELEEDGLREIDKITAATGRKLQIWNLMAWILSGIFLMITVAASMIFMALAVRNIDLGILPAVIILPVASMAIMPLAIWRQYQYGLGRLRGSQPALYVNASRKTVEVFEELFRQLCLRTGPKAYYYDRSGRRRRVGRRLFMGRLRVLLLSEDEAYRCLVSPTAGIWFSAPIFIEAEPEDIIKLVKARPQSGGRKREYDYEGLLLALIEHPKLDGVIPGEHGAEAKVMRLIHDVSQPSEDSKTEFSVPAETELRKFAKRILAAVEKNRALRASVKS
jgi:hypothetical protein